MKRSELEAILSQYVDDEEVEGPEQPKRSRPAAQSVDGVPMRDLSAAAIATNVAQLAALDRVEADGRKTRRLLVIVIVLLAGLIAFIVIMTPIRAKQIESLDRRVDALEKRLFNLEHPTP